MTAFLNQPSGPGLPTIDEASVMAPPTIPASADAAATAWGRVAQQGSFSLDDPTLRPVDTFESDAKSYATDVRDPQRGDAVSVASLRLHQVFRHIHPRQFTPTPTPMAEPTEALQKAAVTRVSPPPPPAPGADEVTTELDAPASEEWASDGMSMEGVAEYSQRSTLSNELGQDDYSVYADSDISVRSDDGRLEYMRAESHMDTSQQFDNDVHDASEVSDTTKALEEIELILQPDSSPISQEQLVAEVKGIYAGLIMVEKKCIEIDDKLMSGMQTAREADEALPSLRDEQYQALRALHKTLLHEHHDFFLASQHPSASPALTRLAAKYAMPTRMWRHGIHAHLEFFRHRLNAPLSTEDREKLEEHFLDFWSLSYKLMDLMKDTVPTFKAEWTECLGDLARYRMALAQDPEVRETWRLNAATSYQEACDLAPTQGRLFHHLGIVKEDLREKMGLFAHACYAPQPFPDALASLRQLLPDIHQGSAQTDPLLAALAGVQLALAEKDATALPSHAIAFLKRLDETMENEGAKFRTEGAHLSMATIACAMGFGGGETPLAASLPAEHADSEAPSTPQSNVSALGQDLAVATFEHVLGRFNGPLRRMDANLLPFLHNFLAFVESATKTQPGLSFVQALPWQKIELALNRLAAQHAEYVAEPPATTSDPLAKMAAGLRWSKTDRKFVRTRARVAPEDATQQSAIDHERRGHILTGAIHIANQIPWMAFDAETHRFAATAAVGTDE